MGYLKTFFQESDFDAIAVTIDHDEREIGIESSVSDAEASHRDRHGNYSIEVIRRALGKAGITVDVLALTFKDENVTLPGFIRHLPILDPNRTAGLYLQSIGVEFDAQEKPLRGPIVADTWQAAFDHARSSTLIWTNFDLIVNPTFYIEINRNLEVSESRRLSRPPLPQSLVWDSQRPLPKLWYP